MKVVSRKTAQAKGFKQYYTGKPCKYGHDCKRYTSNTKCIECEKSPDIDVQTAAVSDLMKGFGIPPKK